MYVQPWARYAVITGSSGVSEASIPTAHASYIVNNYTLKDNTSDMEVDKDII